MSRVSMKIVVNGAEVELNGRITQSFQVRFGVGYEHTDINDPGA